MMDRFRYDDEEFQFFDALEEMELEFDQDWKYDVWLRTPESVGQRRRKFIGLMGLTAADSGEGTLGERDDCNGCVSVGDVDGIVEDNGRGIEDKVSPRISLESSSHEYRNEEGISKECVSEEVLRLGKIRGRRLRHLLSFGKFGNVSKVHPSVLRMDQRAVEASCCRTPRKKGQWLRRWHSVGCLSRYARAHNMVFDGFGHALRTRIKRVEVRRRKSKELSSLFMGQDIPAHDGPILAMKFSPDGRYLASAGEDKTVRVWQVVEDERIDTIDIPACIVFPRKVFRVLEKPLHVFRGHTAAILDLLWSMNNCLLSSSADKTVRLWCIGYEQCLKVFCHTNYVTCIQFNPQNDDFFISGSLDGKVRIWRISSCQVVQWTEINDIITAVSYHPNGQGGIIGSITGTCRFFTISENNCQLETEICLSNKRKSTCKRITGFQFFPQDPSKVLVTCADSNVRIIDGSNVIAKFKGNYMSDGKRIVSASDDSNVYIWNYVVEWEVSFQQTKMAKSFECFSSDSSVAVPWPGFNNELSFSSFSSSLEDLLVSTPKGSATWPEEKLAESRVVSVTSRLRKSKYRVLMSSSCESWWSSHAWGVVIVTGGRDGRIRSFRNYGLPAPR